MMRVLLQSLIMFGSHLVDRTWIVVGGGSPITIPDRAVIVVR